LSLVSVAVLWVLLLQQQQQLLYLLPRDPAEHLRLPYGYLVRR
jgi:hypothetical protein